MEATSFHIGEPKEMFPKLPALARRLGVEPGDKGGGVQLHMKDGTTYDLFALVNAFLDRLEAQP
jgi:hypothetical protein